MERREFFGGRKLDLSNILAVAVRITGSEGWTSEMYCAQYSGDVRSSGVTTAPANPASGGGGGGGKLPPLNPQVHPPASRQTNFGERSEPAPDRGGKLQSAGGGWHKVTFRHW